MHDSNPTKSRDEATSFPNLMSPSDRPLSKVKQKKELEVVEKSLFDKTDKFETHQSKQTEATKIQRRNNNIGNNNGSNDQSLGSPSTNLVSLNNGSFMERSGTVVPRSE
jgi:hypothetical protein